MRRKATRVQTNVLPKATEAQIQAGCLNLLVLLGWVVLRINSGAATQTDRQTGQTRHIKFCKWQAPGFNAQSAGVSDILAMDPLGRFWAIECKAEGKRANLTQSQMDFQVAVRTGGGIAVVIDDIELLKAEIEKRGNQ